MKRLIYLIKWNWKQRLQYQCKNTWYVWKGNFVCEWCGNRHKIESKFFASLKEAL